MCGRNYKTEKRDRNIYAYGLKIKTTNIGGIYPRLNAFGEVGAIYHIEINWVGIAITVRGKR